MVSYRNRRLVKDTAAYLLLLALPFPFFSLLFPFDTWYDSSSSLSLELLDMLDDALVAFSSSFFFFLTLLLFLFLLASLLSLLSYFFCFFSSNRCSSFSLAFLFSFLASFLLLSLSLRALSASVASRCGSVVLLAVDALSSLLSVSTSTYFIPLVPPPGSIPHAVKHIWGNPLWYHL